MGNAIGKGISILFANAKSWQNTRMLWNDGLRNGNGFPDSFRTRITERMQKEGIFISQFENTFIIYRANLQWGVPFASGFTVWPYKGDASDKGNERNVWQRKPHGQGQQASQILQKIHVTPWLVWQRRHTGLVQSLQFHLESSRKRRPSGCWFPENCDFDEKNRQIQVSDGQKALNHRLKQQPCASQYFFS